MLVADLVYLIENENGLRDILNDVADVIWSNGFRKQRIQRFAIADAALAKCLVPHSGKIHARVAIDWSACRSIDLITKKLVGNVHQGRFSYATLAKNNGVLARLEASV
jgi:hypothetical protein